MITSIFLLSILTTGSALSLSASFSASITFALAMLTSLCDQRRWFLSLLTSVILSPLLKMIYRVATISCCDALRPSEQSDAIVDRVPLVLTYHPFNTKIKEFLLQNFHILSMDEQTRSVFLQPPFVVFKHDISLRNMLVHCTILCFHWCYVVNLLLTKIQSFQPGLTLQLLSMFELSIDGALLRPIL